MAFDPKKQPYLTSFGRNRGRALRPLQQKLIDEVLPTLRIDLATLPEKVALEIGFGGGEHLIAQAVHAPETLFIGCEPYINGVARCLSAMEAQGDIRNIRLFTDDARKLIEAMPGQSVDSIFILFPDPWPKERHKKRRLVNAKTLAMLSRIHKPGGRLLIATDHVDYSEWILEVLLTSPHYQWTAKARKDWQNPPADWTQTKYQRKTTEQGRLPVFMECVRK